MKMIDSHAHVNFEDFNNDRKEVVDRSLEAGIWMVNVGCDYETSKKAVEMAEARDKGVYASVGLHPGHADEPFGRERYGLLARSEKVVAIGETGLDRYNRPKNKEKRREFEERQLSLFAEHLDLAESLDLPVIIHCRSAHEDMAEILRERRGRVRGVVHCFTGEWKDARTYLDLGLYIGFTGIIFKLNLERSVTGVPLDRMLVETDCPYLTPPSMSGRNEPLYVKEMVKSIAGSRGEDEGKIAEMTTANARRLFDI